MKAIFTLMFFTYLTWSSAKDFHSTTAATEKRPVYKKKMDVQKRYLSDNQWSVVEPRQPAYYKPRPLNDYHTIIAEQVQQTTTTLPVTEQPNAFGIPVQNEQFSYEQYYGGPLQRHWFGTNNLNQQQQGNILSPILSIAVIIIIIIVILSIVSTPFSTTTVPVRRTLARRNDDIDWSALNILDYISMMEEVWRKFDVKDMECQKRVICELHQNEEEFGSIASNVVSLFKYLRYLTLVKLPGDMQDTFADYLHAAEQGRDAKNDCSKVFDTCDFSVKDTYQKYFSKDNKLKKK